MRCVVSRGECDGGVCSPGTSGISGVCTARLAWFELASVSDDVVLDSGSAREDACFDSAPVAFCLLTHLSLLFLFRAANILVSFRTSKPVVCSGNNS
ncbi:hypothetical protein V6N12_066352 [Hibiscus sabdariffa]|uniref:Uncharacterized protein n=1 Tax=Hibiscus sabdariffa TaxID=183260 RepID=A0ABR2CPV8_9ROSI